MGLEIAVIGAFALATAAVAIYQKRKHPEAEERRDDSAPGWGGAGASD